MNNFRRFTSVFTLVLFLFWALPCLAQDCPDDDGLVKYHHLTAAPNLNAVESVNASVDDHDLCGGEVKVGAKIDGYTLWLDSGWSHTNSSKFASSSFPLCGQVVGESAYHYHYNNGQGLVETQPTHGALDIFSVDCGTPEDNAEECWAEGGYWDETNQTCIPENCPLLLNLDNRSFRLTSAADGVVFDIRGDGSFPLIGWTAANSSVAFLALDRNANGQIDNGTELFGTATMLSTGAKAANGFEALIDLDGGPARSDGRIDGHDAVFYQLLLWRDSNHNGISEPEELERLADSSVKSILLAYYRAKHHDSHGNTFLYQGRVLVNPPSDSDAANRRLVFDVNFTR